MVVHPPSPPPSEEDGPFWGGGDSPPFHPFPPPLPREASLFSRLQKWKIRKGIGPRDYFWKLSGFVGDQYVFCSRKCGEETERRRKEVSRFLFPSPALCILVSLFILFFYMFAVLTLLTFDCVFLGCSFIVWVRPALLFRHDERSLLLRLLPLLNARSLNSFFVLFCRFVLFCA